MRVLLILVLTTLLSACLSTPVYQGYYVDKENNKVLYGDGNPFASLANMPQKVISRTVSNADVNTFEVLDAKGYAKDKNYVYHYGKTVPFADPASFEVLSDLVSKDKNHLFYRAQPIKGVSAQDAKLLNPSAELLDQLYILSQGRVFINMGEINFTPCDAKSLKVLKDTSYIKDNKCVFYRGIKLEGANPKKFKDKSWDYSVDNKNVYFEGKKLAQVSSKGFDVLSYDYAENDDNVFFRDKLLVGVSTKDFEPLRYGYAKNIQGVYFEGKLLEGANRKLFRLSGYEKGTDTQNCYYKSEKVDCETYKSSSKKEQNAQVSVFDGVDLGKRLTPKEINESVSKMVGNLLKMKQLNIQALDDKLQLILEEQKSTYEGQYLTPETVEQIDLSKLEAGFSFELYTPAVPRKHVLYELRNFENNTANFVLHTLDHFGALVQQRSLKGETLLTSESLFRGASKIDFAPFECTFQLGKCKHSKVYGYSDNPIQEEFDIEYQDGYWIRTTQTTEQSDKQELFLFDQYGFILVHAIKHNGKLSNLWLRLSESKGNF
ncbi:hypothetical protein CWB73_05030 [Pseudoalteromonas phenolica]|uniref:DKNYY family protein n=1 Tax=Pseudoalteromonas phenolica TaxID=161398 RepID=A0A5S3YWF1_9GAMM|nr:DKNYY domain-containing protein [Pseudoalteromonas phenolica]TMP82255.1 hypothetical protein CWB73_05030 [Pseudoalteromonas phenolica]